MLSKHRKGSEKSVELSGPFSDILNEQELSHSYQLSTPWMSMRARRFQFTAIRLMWAVALSAVVLGCLVEQHKIKRTQSFFRQQAAKYAQLEKAENVRKSSYLAQALSAKQIAQRLSETSQDERAGDRFFPTRVNEKLLASRKRYYDTTLELEKTFIIAADQARINSERHGKLRRRYEEAANRLWLPFAPNPLGWGK
jgi:outer membrane murein-binding lipoprotein Lpp